MSTPYSSLTKESDLVDDSNFSNYLIENGIRKTLVNILFELYNEINKPDNPIEYIQKKLGDTRPPVSDFNSVLKELAIVLREKQSLLDKMLLLEPQSEQNNERSMSPSFDLTKINSNLSLISSKISLQSNLYEDFI